MTVWCAAWGSNGVLVVCILLAATPIYHLIDLWRDDPNNIFPSPTSSGTIMPMTRATGASPRREATSDELLSSIFGTMLDGFPFGKVHGRHGRRSKNDFRRPKKLPSTPAPRTQSPPTQAGELDCERVCQTGSGRQ